MTEYKKCGIKNNKDVSTAKARAGFLPEVPTRSLYDDALGEVLFLE
jgi:hypothetical protein